MGLGLGLGLTAYAAVPVIFPVNGGTGISNTPSYGNILVGNVGGTYTLTATSSLGIMSGSSASSTLLSDNNTFTGTNNFNTAATTTMQFGLVAGQGNFVVTGSGFVGIETFKPIYALDVNGTLRSGTYFLGSDLGLFPVGGGQSVIQTFHGLQLDGTTATTPETYTPASVGIGADAYNVVVNMNNSSAAGLAVLGISAQTGNYFEANSNANKATTHGDVFNIAASGNVGIGTTTPGSVLSIGNTGSNTINISTTATSTFGSGLNIKTGCYAINGTCLSTGASSGTSKILFATSSTITAYLTVPVVAGNVVSITGNACATTGSTNPTLTFYTSNFNSTSTVDGGSGGSSGIINGEYLFSTYTATTSVTIGAQVSTGGFACTAAGGSSAITKLSIQVLSQ